MQIRNGEGEIILEANTEKPEKVFFIDNPRVWNGKKDPYLYTAKMIMEGSGDEVSTIWYSGILCGCWKQDSS